MAPLSVYEGTINAGSQLYLGISLAPSVNTLAPGVYTGNISIVNEGSGSAFTVTVTLTIRAPLVYEFPLDVNPGWSIEGQWAFGVPLGGGSNNGDPNAAYTGANVYGYNLAGNYTNSLPEEKLTTSALNFTDVTGVKLRFMRWLGVEQGSYDRAAIRVSNNGTTWATVWTNPSNEDVEDTGWMECVYDISEIADGQSQVYVQWVMGPTDNSVAYPGWNIDDIQFLGLRIAEGEGESEVEGEGEPEGECDTLTPYFTALPTSGAAPLIVSFTNLTTGHDGVIWEFGDGDYTMDWNPIHTFTTPGTYSVTLRAWNLCEEKYWQEPVLVFSPEGEGEGEPVIEGEGEFPVPHPADTDNNFRMVLSEAVTYLSGWQQGAYPIAYAIRAAYLWQNGETYLYDAAQEPPLCWVLD